MSQQRRSRDAADLCPVCEQLLATEEITVVDDQSGRRSHVACWCQSAMWEPEGVGPLAIPGGIIGDGRTAVAARASRRRSRSAPHAELSAPDAADLLIVALKRAGERARYVTIEADDELAGMIERLSEASPLAVAESSPGRPALSMRRAAS